MGCFFHSAESSLEGGFGKQEAFSHGMQWHCRSHCIVEAGGECSERDWTHQWWEKASAVMQHHGPNAASRVPGVQITKAG